MRGIVNMTETLKDVHNILMYVMSLGSCDVQGDNHCDIV